MAPSDDPARQFGDRLQEIADALGVPISHFFDERPPPPLGEILDLIRAYAAITDPTGRRWVMNLVLMEAARCQDPSRPQS